MGGGPFSPDFRGSLGRDLVREGMWSNFLPTCTCWLIFLAYSASQIVAQWSSLTGLHGTLLEECLNVAFLAAANENSAISDK